MLLLYDKNAYSQYLILNNLKQILVKFYIYMIYILKNTKNNLFK